MKTASLTYPKHYYIDIAPLAARYDVITASMLAMLDAGCLKSVSRLTHTLIDLVRTYSKLGAHNILLTRKLNMLTHKPWRERVLKELGGMRKLGLWEAARDRIVARNAANQNKPVIASPPPEPAWLYTLQRIAESERLKAWARDCGRAAAHPRIFRDKYKMDFEGEFRLAPLPKGPQMARQIRVYTQASISDYSWNNIPISKEQGFGPALVWPEEFYAAAVLEAKILQEAATSPSLSQPTPSLLLVIPAPEPGSNSEDSSSKLDPRAREGDKIKDSSAKWLDGVPVMRPQEVMTPKKLKRIFGDATA